MKHKLIFLLALVSLAASSCGLGMETVTFTVPKQTESIAEASRWKIVYTDGYEEASLVIADGESFSLSLPRNCCIPIVGYPLAETGQQPEKPYGAIYPYTTSLTKADGFAADILRTLYTASTKETSAQDECNCDEVQIFLSRFNWQRFMETCRTFDDAWLLDRERILLKIAGGTFTKSDFKLLLPE
jgi:hypothetical protein